MRMENFKAMIWLLPTLLMASVAADMDEKLYLLKIRLRPSAGSNQAQEVFAIKNLLTDVSGIDVLFLVKELANPYILAVVDVEDDCRWPALTNVLYSMDDEYSALPLYGCENFAKELDVELTGLTRDFGNGTLHVTDMLFYTTGYTTTEYLDILKDHLTIINNAIANNTAKLACFRVLSDVPVKMIYLTNVHPSQVETLMKVSKLPERAQVTVRAYDNLNDYYC
ncbi:uncharacterized protein LOC124147216 [Haliotis rufescens]|uniref:uncharacterized protein LOC124147216 n=1 Tax=Haliotis rufescens TaxID=6454 RepID=UPI00201EEFB9|nr:uncharacterized protein LOC124147216 [Haliotis rufescens]XP_046373810.2 uncharacterized protein LOC124147216 [Haliotis rufescens]